MSLRSPLPTSLQRPARGSARSALGRAPHLMCSPCGKLRRSLLCFASAGGDKPPLSGKLVGLGSAGVDYLASVDKYPQPDAKIRTEKLEVQGGGNCGNALTAAARLGLKCSLFSKIGGDSLGDGILTEFAREGAGRREGCSECD